MAKDYEVNVVINGEDKTAGKFTNVNSLMNDWITKAAAVAAGF